MTIFSCLEISLAALGKYCLGCFEIFGQKRALEPPRSCFFLIYQWCLNQSRCWCCPRSVCSLVHHDERWKRWLAPAWLMRITGCFAEQWWRENGSWKEDWCEAVLGSERSQVSSWWLADPNDTTSLFGLGLYCSWGGRIDNVVFGNSIENWRPAEFETLWCNSITFKRLCVVSILDSHKPLTSHGLTLGMG